MSDFSAFNQRLKTILKRRGLTDSEAEDVIQEARAKLHVYGQTQDVENLEAFLVRTSVNLAIDAGRRKQRSPISERDITTFSVVDPYPGPAEILDARQRFKRMSDGLSAMTSKNRSILLAHRVEGLTYPQIAKREGITVSAVERQISRAVAFLTEWMEGW